jgi:DNA-directed RNA polymerase specialized sigma24 family protein
MVLTLRRFDEELLPEAMPRPRSMSVTALVAAHRAEMSKRDNGRPNSDAFGVELFRRAVADRDPSAWEAVVQQYRGLVRTWVRGHAAYASSRADADDIAIHAFARFWSAVGPDKQAVFTELAASMRYLKMCVHSVLLDEVRALARTPEPSAGEQDAEELAVEHDSEDLVFSRLAAAELWGAVTRALTDEAERLVVYLSYARGLKPSAIWARHSDRFASVADVHRVKRNALDHLRRSPEIRALEEDG